MKVQLIRYATLRLNINNKMILVDPMLSSKGEVSPVPKVKNQNKNPLVELPIESRIVAKADAMLLTHIHRDHFDEVAIKLLAKDMPILCQPEDKLKIEEKGFNYVNSIDKNYSWNDINFNRTGGQHGTGEIGKLMGVVSGYVISVKSEPSVYVTGDTIWCKEVEEAVETYNPQIIISFAGSAQFSDGGPITMTKEDILQLCKKAPKAKIIVVHMEAWNHCGLTRVELKEFLDKNSLSEQVYVPVDGEIIEL